MPNTLTEILAQWPLWGITTTAPEPEQIQPLPQGLTNQGYVLVLPSGRYVLRIAAVNSSSLGINREAEYQIHQLLTAKGLAPQIHYRAVDNSYWLRDYVEGTVLSAADLTPANLEEMGRYLQQIHQLDVPAELPLIDVDAKINSYLATLKMNASQTAGDFTHLKHPTQLCLCHMDPTPANWLRTASGQLLLLDWEYAGLGNPLWDWAALLQQAQLNDSQERQFLASLGQVHNTAWFEAKLQMRFLEQLWYRVQKLQG